MGEIPKAVWEVGRIDMLLVHDVPCLENNYLNFIPGRGQSRSKHVCGSAITPASDAWWFSASSTQMTVSADRSGAFHSIHSIATVGLNLPERGHWDPATIIGFVLRFRGPLGSGGRRILGQTSLLAVPLMDGSGARQPTERAAATR
jgi:hypothetical protein